MLHKFLVFYKQNKITIFVTLGLAILIVSLVHIANNNIKNTNSQRSSSSTTSSVELEKNNTENTNAFYSSDSQVTGQEISKLEIKKANEYIGKFLENCIRNEGEEAYKLLTDECKQAMFQNQEDFERIYLPKILKVENAEYDITNWVNDTYKVRIFENPLITGKQEEELLTDYITLVEEENEEYKININGYIKKEEINKTVKDENEELEIKISKRNIFMDYEEFEIEVKNNSSTNILLDTKQYTNSMYIEDANGVKYGAYTQMLSDTNLTVYRENIRKLKIRYYSRICFNKKYH